MATAGTYISGVGHTALVIWLVAGWGFQSEPLPFDVAEVSVVTSEEFAALTAASTPDPVTQEPDVPQAPPVEAPPEAPAEDTPPESGETPTPVTEPTVEAAPPEPPEPPAPVTEVEDVAPAPPAPPDEPSAPDLAISDRPQPRPAPRVAPVPVAPAPDASIADVVQNSATPDTSEPAEVVEEPQEATAPEEATTEIVTEAETPSGAVTTSLRPQVRPNRPKPQPEPSETPNAQEPDVSDTDDAVAAALASALAGATQSDAPTGPPMTSSEREGLRVAVNACWNVDPGSVAARVIVEVGFGLDPSGKVSGEVRLLGSDGDKSATQTAFQAARRAILRCQKGGYDLPAEKYDQWKDVVITFDPSGMRLR